MRNGRARPAAIAGIAVLCLSCGRPKPPGTADVQTLTRPVEPDTTMAGGRVVGRVAAADGSAPVVITLEPRDGRSIRRPAGRQPVMDQAGLTFAPAFLLARTGEPAEFRNSDDTLHNVHVTHEESRQGAFNVAIPIGAAYTFTFERDGFYHVGCDIHPAMSAEILATSAAFAIVAESDGRFTFSDVDPGSYSMTVFANGTRARRDVEVKRGVTEVTF